MKPGQIIKDKNYPQFAIVPIEVLRDKNLSAKAMGIYCYLASHNEEFTLNKTYVQNAFKDGRDSIATGFNELIDAGYLEQIQVKSEKGQFAGYAYRLLHAENQLREIRRRETRVTENPQQSNTVNKKINKELSRESEKTPSLKYDPPIFGEKFKHALDAYRDYLVDSFEKMLGPSQVEKICLLFSRAKASEEEAVEFLDMVIANGWRQINAEMIKKFKDERSKTKTLSGDDKAQLRRAAYYEGRSAS